MTKNAVRTIVVLAVVFVVFTVIAFAVPFAKSAVFWISYVFGLVAIAAQGYALHAAFAGQGSLNSKLYGFPVARVGFVYMVVQLVLSLVLMILAAIAPVWVALVLDVILFGAAAVGFITTDAMREEIQRQDQVLKKDVAAMRALQSRTHMLAGQCSDGDTAALIRRLAEDLRYSDPVSSEATEDMEAELSRLIDELQRSVTDQDYPGAAALCRQASVLLTERNRLCRLSK